MLNKLYVHLTHPMIITHLLSLFSLFFFLSSSYPSSCYCTSTIFFSSSFSFSTTWTSTFSKVRLILKFLLILKDHNSKNVNWFCGMIHFMCAISTKKYQTKPNYMYHSKVVYKQSCLVGLVKDRERLLFNMSSFIPPYQVNPKPYDLCPLP